jgi:hypothetical protein
MKEYQLLYKFRYSPNLMEAPFDVISQVLYGKSTHLLKLKECREHVNKIFDYLELKHRFDALEEAANQTLIFTNECFKLDLHEFETLDEVERALKNKAFL